MTSEMRCDLRDILLISLCYTLAYGIMLANTSVVWDDWVLVCFSPSSIMNLFKATGSFQNGYLHNLLQSLPHAALVYRLIVFTSFLLSAFSYYFILKHGIIPDRTARFFIVSFFALFPVNHARIAMINTPSSISYLSFALASLLLFRLKWQGSVVLRILVLSLYFLSFSTPSFLVLYIPVMASAIKFDQSKGKEKKRSWTVQILSFCDFMLLPIAFWLVKTTFLKPYGVYLGYNQLALQGLWHAVKWFPIAVYTSFVEPLIFSFEFLTFTVLLGGVLLAGYIKSDHKESESIYSHTSKLLIFGLTCFCAGVTPYLAVYKLPQLFADWESRHQLLVPLGASLLIYFGGQKLFDTARVPRAWQLVIFSLMVVLFVRTDLEFQIMYEQDALKQQSLIENFRKSGIMHENTAFIFDDLTLGLNVNKRTYRYYEYTGLMKMALGGEKRFGLSTSEYGTVPNSQRVDVSDFENIEYKTFVPQYRIVINYGDYPLTVQNIVRLKLRQLFTPQQFRSNVAKVVKLTFVQL